MKQQNYHNISLNKIFRIWLVQCSKKAECVKNFIKLRSVSAFRRYYTTNMEIQHHVKVLSDNGFHKFGILEPWITHSDLGVHE